MTREEVLALPDRELDDLACSLQDIPTEILVTEGKDAGRKLSLAHPCPSRDIGAAMALVEKAMATGITCVLWSPRNTTYERGWTAQFQRLCGDPENDCFWFAENVVLSRAITRGFVLAAMTEGA